MFSNELDDKSFSLTPEHRLCQPSLPMSPAFLHIFGAHFCVLGFLSRQLTQRKALQLTSFCCARTEGSAVTPKLRSAGGGWSELPPRLNLFSFSLPLTLLQSQMLCMHPRGLKAHALVRRCSSHPTGPCWPLPSSHEVVMRNDSSFLACRAVKSLNPSPDMSTAPSLTHICSWTQQVEIPILEMPPGLFRSRVTSCPAWPEQRIPEEPQGSAPPRRAFCQRELE